MLTTATFVPRSNRMNYALVGLFVLIFLPFYLVGSLVLLLACLLLWPFRNWLILLIAGFGVLLLRTAINIARRLVQFGNRVVALGRVGVALASIRRRLNRRRVGQPAP